MSKAILAAIVTLFSGYLGCIFGYQVLGGWMEFGILVAVSVMGGLIIYFNDKKK